ncbi:multiple epidermal growth factor-like domains protein 10 [Littorina saxatilis]|uniref:multiple epidermal growth factor-like domains protein 10 n=1 Tax=Littorina saxatilis TaxID=31220 RepID=UPI0038B4F5F0
MAPSTLSLFLTALMFAGVQGAVKDLDATCDAAADTCTNSVNNAIVLTCDALVSAGAKCHIKVGQDCNDPTSNSDKCVTGADCDTASSNKCLCGSGHTATASNICAPDTKFGGACTGGPDAQGNCDDTNALCSAASDGTCGCKSGYTGTDGQGCTISDNKFGGSCTADTANIQGTCADENALCSAATGGTCKCKAGYTGTDGAGCVVTANTFGGACTGGPDVKGTCVDANGVCSGATGTCDCKATYSGAVGASCVMDNQVGGTCSVSGQGSCTDTNALCTSLKCVCKDGYDGSAGGTCTKIADNTFGGSCTTTSVDAKGTCVDANAECPALTGGFCTCKANYDGYAGSGCALANKLGGKCTTMTKGTKGTCESAGAVCSMQVDGRCVMSGAKAVVASVTSLVLACIVCLLAIN